MLDIYADFAVNDAAIPVIPGKEIGGGKICGRRHHVCDRSDDGRLARRCSPGRRTSWARISRKLSRCNISTRTASCNIAGRPRGGFRRAFIGAIIMVHGDDQGLVLPPKLAPYQVVIVPIFKTDEEKATVLETARKLKAELVAGERARHAGRARGQSPGWKFNDWEMRGVPAARRTWGPRMSRSRPRCWRGATVLAEKGRSARSLAGLPADY